MKKFLSLSIAMLSLTMISSCSQKNEESHSSETFTIYWRDWDNTILKISKDVPYGETPVYTGSEPFKEADAKNAYTFSGWSPDVGPAYKDETYVAQYTETINEYTITWQNYDGSVLSTETYKYGETPVFKGDIPSRPKDAQYTYSFSKWSPSIENVSKDVVYVAQYDTDVNSYTVIWKNYDGSVLSTETYDYGETPTFKGEEPTRNMDEEFYYDSYEWSPAVGPVHGDVEYIASFNAKNIMTFVTFTDSNYALLDSVYNGVTNLVIPNTYKGKIVSSIRSGAIQCPNLTSITLPSSLKVIGSHAFENCPSLKSLYIPSNVNSIGKGAFTGCTSIENIEGLFLHPASTTNASDLSFVQQCPNMLSYYFENDGVSFVPETLKTVSVRNMVDKAFTDCSNITTINLTGSPTSIGKNAFKGCSSLTTINIPDSVTEIKDYAFFGCTSLTSIEISDSTTSIGDFAFADCSLLETVSLPASLELIGDSAFANCGSLSSIAFPDCLRKIGPFAFQNCTSLTSFTIPKDIELVSHSALNGCASLECLSLPLTFFTTIMIGEPMETMVISEVH